jgi:hypothetical protein
MPGVSLKNEPVNGGSSLSTGAYQIDMDKTIGILGWVFHVGWT